MPGWLRYALFQLPGAALVAVLLLVFWERTELSAAAGVALFAAWIVKDVLLYPLFRRAYEPDARSAGERLVGCVGVAREELNPHGQILVKGEIWRASTLAGEEPIPAGAEVVVRGADRFTLLVMRGR